MTAKKLRSSSIWEIEVIIFYFLSLDNSICLFEKIRLFDTLKWNNEVLISDLA